jgi:hypothetical protein
MWRCIGDVEAMIHAFYKETRFLSPSGRLFRGERAFGDYWVGSWAGLAAGMDTGDDKESLTLPRTEPRSFKRYLHDAGWLTRVKCRGCARRCFMQVMISWTGLNLKLVATSIILLAWNVCARIPGTWLARANSHRVNAASAHAQSLYELN